MVSIISFNPTMSRKFEIGVVIRFFCMRINIYIYYAVNFILNIGLYFISLTCKISFEFRNSIDCVYTPNYHFRWLPTNKEFWWYSIVLGYLIPALISQLQELKTKPILCERMQRKRTASVMFFHHKFSMEKNIAGYGYLSRSTP